MQNLAHPAPTRRRSPATGSRPHPICLWSPGAPCGTLDENLAILPRWAIVLLPIPFVDTHVAVRFLGGGHYSTATAPGCVDRPGVWCDLVVATRARVPSCHALICPQPPRPLRVCRNRRHHRAGQRALDVCQQADTGAVPAVPYLPPDKPSGLRWLGSWAIPQVSVRRVRLKG